MIRKLPLLGITFAFSCSLGFAADNSAMQPKITAAEVANRNASARGGLQAWRAVQAISESGELTAGGNQRTALSAELAGIKRPGKSQPLPSSPRLKEEAQLPFVMEMERPRKLRFELQFRGQTAIQVYDGANGWKLRPYLNRMEVEPYTDDESKLAAMQAELDGPLMDYAAKGTRIELGELEKVDGRDTYNLKLMTKAGQTIHVWVDAQTFLETKIEGQPRRLDGKMHPVEIYYRDYRSVNGLQIPFLLETRVLPSEGSASKTAQAAVSAEKIVIEKIVLNPKLDNSLFARPQVQMASTGH